VLRFSKITALGGLTLGLVSALAASLMLRHHLEIRGPTLAEPARIQVETGVSLAELGENLRLANLIEEPLMFAALAR
jgi:hypothetical protein